MGGVSTVFSRKMGLLRNNFFLSSLYFSRLWVGLTLAEDLGLLDLLALFLTVTITSFSGFFVSSFPISLVCARNISISSMSWLPFFCLLYSYFYPFSFSLDIFGDCTFSVFCLFSL